MVGLRGGYVVQRKQKSRDLFPCLEQHSHRLEGSDHPPEVASNAAAGSGVWGELRICKMTLEPNPRGEGKILPCCTGFRGSTLTARFWKTGSHPRLFSLKVYAFKHILYCWLERKTRKLELSCSV